MPDDQPLPKFNEFRDPAKYPEGSFPLTDEKWLQSGRGWFLVAIAVVSIFVIRPIGLIAFYLATKDLGAMNRKMMATDDRRLTQLAQGIGLLTGLIGTINLVILMFTSMRSAE